MIAPWGWRRTFLSYLVGTAGCSFALGGLASVRLSQRFLGDLLTGSTARGAFAIDGSTALSWSDTLFSHDLTYVVFLFGAAVLAFFAFALRDIASRRPGTLPVWPLLFSLFGLGALASAHIDRALTKGLFDPSHVTASRVLEPFYAYDVLYWWASFALVGVLTIVWLGWMLSRQSLRGQGRAS